MQTLTLPASGRRAFVRAFWFTLAAACVGGTTALADVAGASLAMSVAAGLCAGAAVAAVPFTAERFARRAYVAWNGRLVRPIAGALRGAATRICFFVVVSAVGRSGGRRGRSHSMDGSRMLLPIDAYRTTSQVATAGPVSAGWVSGYLRWAWRSGNVWSVALLPFLAVLRLVAEGEGPAPQENIYTLF